MASFAPVAPLPILRQLAEVDSLGTYQLLIAPVVLDRETEYRAFFREHDDQFVIVDNGVIEKGYALGGLLLWRAAEIVGASLVVMPDTINDARMTVKQVRHGIEEYHKFDKSTDLMGVVQGTNVEECMWCAKQMVEAGVDWLGVPRGLTPNLGTRVRLVKALGAEFNKPMHVLGWSDDVVDDIVAATEHPLVRGMDAATPVWLGMRNERLGWAPPVYGNFGSRPRAYWESERAGDIDPIQYNVDRVRGWLRDPNVLQRSSAVRTVPTEKGEPAGRTGH